MRYPTWAEIPHQRGKKKKEKSPFPKQGCYRQTFGSDSVSNTLTLEREEFVREYHGSGSSPASGTATAEHFLVGFDTRTMIRAPLCRGLYIPVG
jgi:hypothetical protein